MCKYLFVCMLITYLYHIHTHLYIYIFDKTSLAGNNYARFDRDSMRRAMREHRLAHCRVPIRALGRPLYHVPLGL